MQRTPHGFAPAPGFLSQQMAALPEFSSPALPAFTVQEFAPLLDSSNMTPADWLKIAHQIVACQDDCDGYVVIHGTDTMAYTASALAFLLSGLCKPVIVTGSQIPLCEVRSDALENLITALLIAGSEPIPEVCLYFGGRLLRGCRATKVSASGLSAFDSPNYPPLGTAGIDLAIHWQAVSPPPPPEAALVVENQTAPRLGMLKFYPGIQPWMVEAVLRPPLQGLVLEAYGVGTGPDHDAALLEVFARAARQGIVVVAVTQCRQGLVRLDSYATSASLARAGVIGGLDMTSEAALTKLFYLFGLGLAPDEVRQKMTENLRGELSLPYPPWGRK